MDEIIFAYTLDEAVEDGVYTPLDSLEAEDMEAQEFLDKYLTIFTIPLLFSVGVMELSAPLAHQEPNEQSRRLSVILDTLLSCISKEPNTSQLSFQCTLPVSFSRLKTYTVNAAINSYRNGAPAIVLFLPCED